jgi:hypothetical protein
MAVDPKELNDEGGIDTRSKEEMERAKKADLISYQADLKPDATNKKLCYNEQVKRTLLSACAVRTGITSALKDHGR